MKNVGKTDPFQSNRFLNFQISRLLLGLYQDMLFISYRWMTLARNQLCRSVLYASP